MLVSLGSRLTERNDVPFVFPGTNMSTIVPSVPEAHVLQNGVSTYPHHIGPVIEKPNCPCVATVV